MYAQNGAARYRAVSGHGLVADARPTRLVQIAFENILGHLAIAQGCMQRIKNDLPFTDVVAKCNAMNKAVLLMGHLDESLDMERGAEVAANLHKLYQYMLERLTVANATNDASLVVEVCGLMRQIKGAWDRIVADGL